jgi:hypothetical protein
VVPLELAGVVDGHKKSATALDVVRQRANGPHLCHRILLRRRYDVDPPGLHLGVCTGNALHMPQLGIVRQVWVIRGQPCHGLSVGSEASEVSVVVWSEESEW